MWFCVEFSVFWYRLLGSVCNATLLIRIFTRFLASFFGPGAPDTGSMLARVLGMPSGAGSDYVYSQADLDRVISQLMEQHQGNAPPPAAKDTIESLPRIKVTQQMVDDGQDCAVCKEELVVAEEVTKLPCNHIYHFECVSRWLEAHDVSFPHLSSLGAKLNDP